MVKSNLISSKIFNILRKQTQIRDFFKDSENIEILIKRLNIEDINRLNIEYPNFLYLNRDDIKSKKKEAITPILSFTFLKHDLEPTNYNKLKKIKIYIDNFNYTKIRIMQN